MDEALESRIRELAEELSRTEPTTWRRPAVAIGRRQLTNLDGHPALRSALFRFVDAAPACRGPLDRGAHLRAFVREVDGERVPITLRPLRSRAAVGPLLAAYGRASGPATALLARQFIAGRDVEDATRTLRGMWRRGQAFALDLLGESTVSEAEAEAYFKRCAETLGVLAEVTRGWPENAILDTDHHGRLARANLSIKLTALSPLLRPLAPERGAADASRRLRPLLQLAREAGAHAHLDMEDFDRRETGPHVNLDMEYFTSSETLLLAFEEVLASEEFRDAPSVRVVVQAYLRD